MDNATSRLWGNTYRRRLLAGVAVAACLVSTACGSSSGSSGGGTSAAGGIKTLEVGAVINETGETSAFEEPALLGLEYAVSQLNSYGGFVVSGQHYKVKLVVAPNPAGDVTTVVADVRSLISQGIKLIFGPPGVGALEAMPLTNAAGVLFPTAASELIPDLGPKNPLVWRTSEDLDEAGVLTADLVHHLLPGVNSLADLEANTAEGKTDVPIESALFNTVGIKNVYTQYFDPSTTDFTSLLTAAGAHDPGLLDLTSESPQNETELTEAIDLHVAQAYNGDVPDALLHTLVPASFHGYVISGGNGIQFLVPVTPQETAFEAGFNKWLGKTFTGYPSQTYYYDPLFMMVTAMEKANSVTNTQAIAQEFSTMTYTGFDGHPALNGPQHYMSNHQIDLPEDFCYYQTPKLTCLRADLSGGKLVIGPSASITY
jgi:ABC-type branched-subunit amino acid transport system substrate-binding protein